MGIMEARKPDRQGRLASLQASSLPCFISCCYVAAWPGLLVPVCVTRACVCVRVCVCVRYPCESVAMWVRPEKMVEAIQASQSWMSSGTVIAAITIPPGPGCCLLHTHTLHTASSILPLVNLFEVCFDSLLQHRVD